MDDRLFVDLSEADQEQCSGGILPATELLAFVALRTLSRVLGAVELPSGVENKLDQFRTKLEAEFKIRQHTLT